jgi:hypothetical protein
VVGVVWLNSVLQKRQSTVCMCMWGDRAEIRPIYVTVDKQLCQRRLLLPLDLPPPSLLRPPSR